MNILKKISKDKLVIVVSHDNMLASKYADRVINITDGKTDYYPQIDDKKFKEIKSNKISIFQILKLAFKNLGLKV
jgi:putative ABC transport system permease protein